MKSTGIVRKLDELGRIVLPMELRRTLEISRSDPIEIYTDNDKIILKKYQRTCIFCDGTDDVTEFHGKMICNECKKNISAAK